MVFQVGILEIFECLPINASIAPNIG